MSGIKLRVLSTLLRHGQRIETGSILTVPATEAADYLDGPKVALLDPADRQVVLAAIIAGYVALLARVATLSRFPRPGRFLTVGPDE